MRPRSGSGESALRLGNHHHLLPIHPQGASISWNRTVPLFSSASFAPLAKLLFQLVHFQHTTSLTSPAATPLVPDKRLDRFRSARMPQLAQRLCFDLSDALSGYSKALPDLFERVVGLFPDPEAHA